MSGLEEQIRVIEALKEGLETKYDKSSLYDSNVTLDLSFIEETVGKISLSKLVDIINDATNNYVFTGKGYTVRIRALESKRTAPLELLVEEEEPNLYSNDIPVFWLLTLHLNNLKEDYRSMNTTDNMYNKDLITRKEFNQVCNDLLKKVEALKMENKNIQSQLSVCYRLKDEEGDELDYEASIL